MSFYIDPAFFILLVPIVAVAAALGVAQKPLWQWAGVSGAAMLAALAQRRKNNAA